MTSGLIQRKKGEDKEGRGQKTELGGGFHHRGTESTKLRKEQVNWGL
jgi:hypothetical protein